MASFFEKLISSQVEEPKAKKPLKKTMELEEEVKEKKEVRRTRKSKPRPRPEPKPEIEIEEEEAEEITQEVQEPTEETEKQKPVQVQAKSEPKASKEKDPTKKKVPEDSGEGQLAIDVYQNEEEIVVQSTIGGIRPSDLEITIENGIVDIKGSRQKTEAVVKDNYFIQECHWGSFSRQLVLPSEVDSSRSEATLKDGVLTIRIPRIQKEKITKLEIKE